MGLLQPLVKAENATLPLELHTRDKTDKNKANFAKLIGAIKASHAGVSARDPPLLPSSSRSCGGDGSGKPTC